MRILVLWLTTTSWRPGFGQPVEVARARRKMVVVPLEDLVGGEDLEEDPVGEVGVDEEDGLRRPLPRR